MPVQLNPPGAHLLSNYTLRAADPARLPYDSGMAVDETIHIRRVSLDEIVSLRHEVLRHGLPRESAIFDGDLHPAALHYGAFASGILVGCATIHASTWEGEPAWQLRGMAVAASHRGTGIGRQLLDVLEADVARATPGRFLWANARVPAARFYEKLGWRIVSDVFDIPTAGLHVKIVKSGTQLE